MRVVEIEPRRGRRIGLLIRLFLEAVLGGLVIFGLAAVLAPRLFDIRNNLAVLGAVLVWIACPILLFLLVSDLAARLRRLRRGPP